MRVELDPRLLRPRWRRIERWAWASLALALALSELSGWLP